MDTSMLSEVNNNIDEEKISLRNAVLKCSELGLYSSAKWAAEALNGFDDSQEINDPIPISQGSIANTIDTEYDKFLLAKTYFDLKEFDRAAFVLRGCKGARSRFLRLYSKYLVGEKRKEEEAQDILDPLDDSQAINKELPAIETELSSLYTSNELDGFLLYLYGVVLAKRNKKNMAIDSLVESVNKYPYNWSAWLELSTCIATAEMLQNISQKLPKNIMSKFFYTHIGIKLHPPTALGYVEELESSFPKSDYLKSQRAMVYYESRDFESAEVIFDELLKDDPFRLEHMDAYSNILYVMQNKPKLSYLAHNSSMTDKYRPETCCIIGNYFSLRGEPEKAVVYFKRALKLNRNYLSAWTLIGHEYIEMNNTSAAIEAYRRAVDIDHRDYRAWYGLGQTYELLKMPFYAVYYFQRATVLRPYEYQFWVALAQCYQTLQRSIEAIKSYERALVCQGCEPIALLQLSRLYSNQDNRDKAAECYRKFLEWKKKENNESNEIAEAALYLANYEKDQRNYSSAELYANEVLPFGGSEKEEAKALLRELRELRIRLNTSVS
ncbi:uncharacterized protein VTP21DRAFT_2043 [Calcarisporiella thermophila]|uniref:uncharacterized protein n=1 Tax=Calcarisporiella thermophila TaxID=911321 RepID=UPI0037438167